MTDTTTRIWRHLSTVDSNAEPSAIYTLAVIAGEAHHIIIARIEGSYQIALYPGIEDLGAGEPLDTVWVEYLPVAYHVAESWMVSTDDLVDTLIECVGQIREHSAGVYGLRLDTDMIDEYEAMAV